jgi:prophage antirepressor-like protein
MKELTNFEFQGQKLRVIEHKGNPWFINKEVCRVLGIANNRDAISRLSPHQKDEVAIADAIGRMQKTTIISEGGLYKLAFQSRKPEAEAFADLVVDVILPSIRKTGTYSVHQNRKELSNSEIATNPELALQTLELHQSMRLAFYRSARDWQGLVNILYPEHKKSRKKSKAEPPNIVIYEGEELKQLMIGFDEVA